MNFVFLSKFVLFRLFLKINLDSSSSLDSIDGSINGGHIPNHQKDYQIDTLNPYFMHPNENPRNIIATPLLKGTNYNSWSRVITVPLRSKHKLCFINGALPHPPNEDCDSNSRDICNTMIISCLNNSKEPKISQSILWMHTASEIWKEHKDHFYQGDIFHISDIQEKIYILKQGD